MDADQARAVLRTKHAAAGGADYAPVEMVGGWLFRWDSPDQQPVGERSWVVTDDGRATQLMLGETPERALDRLQTQYRGHHPA